MTIRKIASTLLLSLAMISFASAQRIAVVDVTAVLESLPEYQKAQEQLDKIATAWRQEIAQEQDKIKGMYSKYQAEQVLLSEEMKKQREEEILEQGKRRARTAAPEVWPRRRSLQKTRRTGETPVQDKVYGAIERFAADKGFEFIFDKGSASGLLFSDSKNDKTDDIKALVKK
jgi:outer membrane protein